MTRCIENFIGSSVYCCRRNGIDYEDLETNVIDVDVPVNTIFIHKSLDEVWKVEEKNGYKVAVEIDLCLSN